MVIVPERRCSSQRKLILECHPDRHPNLDAKALKQAEDRTKQINLAYAVLKSTYETTEGVSKSRVVRGKAPDLESLIRHAVRSVEDASNGVDAWARHLKRARTSLADGRRLLTATDRSYAQFKRLEDSVAQLIEYRKATVNSSFDAHCLRPLRLDRPLCRQSGLRLSESCLRSTTICPQIQSLLRKYFPTCKRCMLKPLNKFCL